MPISRVPDPFIETLRHRIDAIDLIQDYVSLKRKGSKAMGLCPFHREKTPSFYVSPDRYYCFGCNQTGDIFQFLMDHEGLSFLETIEHLAAKAGLSVPTTQQQQTQNQSKTEFSSDYDLLEKITQLYQMQLKTHPSAKVVINYLKNRGLTGEIAKQFSLGFAPPGWHYLENALKASNSQKDQLKKLGLVTENEKGHHYDRFRNRIIFPIRNRQGRVVGFGGRVIDATQPKYLNSPETTVFHKSQELYGLYHAKKANRTLSHLIIVEGYLDVIALFQYGITHCVATLGTAFNEKHALHLLKQTHTLYFCFDGDAAGKLAAWRALQVCLPLLKAEYKISFCFLPQGLDPDSFIRAQGKAAVEQRLHTAMTLMDYLLETLVQRVNLSQLEGRAQLVASASPFIRQIPDKIVQQLLYQRLSDLTGLDPMLFEKNKRHSKQTVQTHQQKNKFKKQSRLGQTPHPTSAVKKAIAFLIADRNLIDQIDDLSWIRESQQTDLNLFHDLVVQLKNSPTLDMQSILEKLSKQERLFLEDKMLQSTAQQVPTGGLQAEFQGVLSQLRERAREQSIEGLLRQSKNGKLTDQQKETLRLLLTQTKEAIK